MNKEFNKGIIFASLGSFWWGVIGVLYFKFISHINPSEVVSHRVLWTVVILLFSIIISRRFSLVLDVFKDKKKNSSVIFFWVINFY